MFLTLFATTTNTTDSAYLLVRQELTLIILTSARLVRFAPPNGKRKHARIAHIIVWFATVQLSVRDVRIQL